MSSENIKVAVRVRPFNQRERNANSKCIISMSGKSTVITDPGKNEKKTFAFDHSYWSHGGYKEDEDGVYVVDKGSEYADQRRVYEDLGKGVLENAWQGYNAALFAYGQTGSGKSYSMIGYGPNKGIVPITCNELFRAIEDNKDSSKKFQVTFSMLEIYNEQVQDLLAVVKKNAQKGPGLKVRQNPKSGFYVEGLKQFPVSSYDKINELMDQGTVNRTTASTNMNATSSRSHMVITIIFKQIYKNEIGQSTTKSSEINLVDLAGSERADSTGATGDRLKEGSAINQSLSSLGNVISALADLSAGKKKVVVPYRDSVLTKLLQGALGGNSKTIMIAALSPAAINYDETLSTLRYADRAKKIKNNAVVNEGLTDKLIRELREENKRLMAKLKLSSDGEKNEELEEMLKSNTDQMSKMESSWEKRLDEARLEWERSMNDQNKNAEPQELDHPYLQNVNEDPQLSGVVKHGIKPNTTKIGRPGVAGVSLELKGLGIKDIHAVIHNTHDEVYIEPHDVHAKVYINGMAIHQRVRLMHLDRIKLGSNSLYLYIGPLNERSASDDYTSYDYDYFQSEIAEADGLKSNFIVPPSPRRGTDSNNLADMEMTLIFQEYVDLLPKINDLNLMSKDMGKDVQFEAEVKNLSLYDTRGRQKEREVIVRVTNVRTKLVWIWSKGKFMNRKYLIEDMYCNWLDGSSVDIDTSQDPFWDPVEDVFLGSCHVWLNNLAYSLDADEHLEFHNSHGRQESSVHVKLHPCDANGKTIEDLHASMVFDPKDLLGRRLDFMLSVLDSEDVKWVKQNESRGIYFTFTFYDHPKTYKSRVIWNTINPRYHYHQHLTLNKVDEDFIQYLSSNALVLELWGTQVGREDSNNSISDGSNSSTVSTSQVLVLEEKLKRQATELEFIRKERDRLKSSMSLTPVTTPRSHVTPASEIKTNSSQSSAKNNNTVTSRSSNRTVPSTPRSGRLRTETQNSLSGSSSKEGILTGVQIKVENNNGHSTTANGHSNGIEKPRSATKQTNFDVEMAKVLKVFFKDMKEVQKKLAHCKSIGNSLPDDTDNLKTLALKQQANVTEIEGNVNNAVGSLREMMLSIIKQKKLAEESS